MIYTMNTKTFIKIFSKEDPKRIEKTQFVVISKRIRKTVEDPNVIFCSKLFPSDMLLADYRIGIEGYFQEKYKEEIEKSKLTLAVIIKGAIEERMPIVFLCTLREWKVGYMKILAEYIMEEFGYPIVNYKKYKIKKELPKEIKQLNERAIIDRCDEVIKQEEKKRKKKLMKTRSGRLELLKSMSTEEMKAQLKKMALYSNGLDKHTMKELLMEFFVER